MPAPAGNDNRNNGRLWRDAIQRALQKRSQVNKREALLEIADALLEKAADGDLEAIKVLGDRLDGKPAQSVSIGGGDAPLEIRWALPKPAIEP